MRRLTFVLWWCAVRVRVCSGRALNETDDRLRGRWSEAPAPHRAWLGCLLPDDEGIKDSNYTGVDPNHRSTIVLIQPATAVTIADLVAEYSQEKPDVQVMFLDEGLAPMLCLVSALALHPEYGRGVKNTLALLYLEHFNIDYEWTPISWAVYTEVPDDTMFVGISFLHDGVEQFYQNVTRVALGTCDAYYKNIGLTSMYEGIGETSVTCYKEQRLYKHSCFYDAGHPLLHRVNGTYVLVALSLKGPGCSNPSRFISLLPYRDFILNSSSTRRGGNVEVVKDEGMEDFYDDLDRSRIPKLFKQKPKMITGKSGWLYKHGECARDWETMVYREQTEYKTTRINTRGIYVLTLYDRVYKQYRCVRLTCHCLRMSEPLLSFITIENKAELDQYMFKVPIKHLNRTIPPKIIFLMDDFSEYYGEPAIMIYIVFEYNDKAVINIEYQRKNN